MKTVGLITEYNPFHNGHKFHIEEAKRITGADYAIAVMSGNFVQRGTPAVIDKYSRAEMALRNGVDLVLELPVCYATASAEFFAHGAVSILDKLGIVDDLCFGSEAGDITLLQNAADFLLDTPETFDDRLQSFLKDGYTYPAARLKALRHTLEASGTEDGQALAAVLTEPNNILGIEYLKAITRLSSSIVPVTIQRKAAHYHDPILANKNADTMSYSEQELIDSAVISSATAIRKAIKSKAVVTDDYFEEIKLSVPDNVFELLNNRYLTTYPITEEDFAQAIKYKLLSESSLSLSEYMDITTDLADRMKNITDLNCSIYELTGKIKTKNMTLTRINRALIHLLLNIKKEALLQYNEHGYASYARVLGIKKESSHLLRKIEQNGSIPIITKVSKADSQLDALALRMLSEDLFAAHLYNQAVYEKYRTMIVNEYKHGICIV
jgi:predicted nucleotidyltransferase